MKSEKVNSMSASVMDQKTDELVEKKASIAQPWKPGQFILRDTWFPLAHSGHVSARPVRRMLHSQAFYLWRDGTRVLASEFHPSVFEKFRAKAGELSGGTGYFPTVERYGYIWVWYGNIDNASEELIPNIPYLPRAGHNLSPTKWGQIYFNASNELCCENLLDLVHADFLHSDIIGDEENEHDEITVYSTSETVTMVREVTGKSIPPALRALGVPAKKADYRGVTHVHLRSGAVVLHGKFTPGFSQPLFHPLIPESSTLTRNNYVFNMSDGSKLARHIFPMVSYIIGPQDDRMMKPQNPLYQAEEWPRDSSTRLDAGGSRYRLLMSKLIARQKQGDFSYLSDADPAADIADVLGCVRAD